MSDTKDSEPLPASDWRAGSSVHWAKTLQVPGTSASSRARAFVLAIGIGLLPLAVVVVGLFASGYFTTTSGVSYRAEGEQLLGSARDAIRVQYSKTGEPPVSISSFTALSAFEGEFYSIRDRLTIVAADPTQDARPQRTFPDPSIRRPSKQFGDDRTGAVIIAVPRDPAWGWGVMTFNWASGTSTIYWFDSEAEIYVR